MPTPAKSRAPAPRKPASTPRARTARPSTRAAYLERVNRAIDLIMANPAKPLSLRALAKAAALSPFHFHRVFQAITGETPADFVKRQRIDRALHLMARTPKPSLTNIALDCGFAQASDFSRAFKHRFGIPPSAFDIRTWKASHLEQLIAGVPGLAERPRLDKLPEGANPDNFRVKLRTLSARTVAYIRVTDPYQGDAVIRSAERLIAWAESNNLADGQWLGYQWENPEITPLEQCKYHVAVEADRFDATGEIGRFRFPQMTVAQVEVKGPIDVELRALMWLYGTWLPRSGYVPADHPCFEAWIGRPFAHGTGHFELHVQLPVKRG
jgi:AraC family transcriptional regulator